MGHLYHILSSSVSVQILNTASHQAHLFDLTSKQKGRAYNPPIPNNMCLVTTPKRDRSLYRREYYDDAPRPVSNYHGGPQYPHHHHHHHHPRNSATYTRRSSSVPRERASYRSSYRNSAPRVYDIDRDVDV